MRASIGLHKCDNIGGGVMILEENLVRISLEMVKILLLMKYDIDLHSQGQRM